MLSMLRQISIQKRLMALVGVSAILMMVGTWISSLSQRSTLMDDRRTQVQRLVEVAVGTLTHFHAQAQSGTLSEEDARAAALTVIGQLRYGDNDYFWVNDLQPRMVMHPIMAKLNGQDMSDLKDPNGVYLFREMLKVVKTPEKSGFVDYAWPKPGHEQPVPKTSFVKLFEPWGWVIGSGIYIDDVDATFRAITLRHGALVVLGIGVLVVLSLIVGLSVVRPLRQTVAALEDIAHGEGDLTRTLPDGGRDEVSQLAQAFNTFSGKIRTLVQQVQGVARSNADITRDVSATVAQAEDSTGHQKAELDTVAAAVEQMVATSQEVSERILAAAEA
ncbi:MAG: methyl-accepting chemotaxis protein, partial [Gammaproteobacteria bacterium]|nr:methyl-accepting chemotaxis protein [Gammaproteobacteria bacterium]